jgi:uncharacterized membrane protein YobD (UPF0266 family)
MNASLVSGLPALALVVLTIVIVFGILIFYALRVKGDVFAELSHGKTTLRIDARDRQRRKRL